MTIEEIRANAPSGATHYIIRLGEVVYYRDPFNLMCRYFDNGEWIIGNMHTHKKPL